ncbi:MAG: glycosyltransferase family 2 protein [Methylophilaceae bacterium]|nr:glycosyltransferase family 2 protein [Methylophilaceae bacterium]
MPSISVIVTTYQRPLALNRVLESLYAQKVTPAEIVIADDGSGAETAALIQSWQARFACPLIHAWQADDGFRAASARNQAVAASSGDYLVFLDGDCLVFPDFIARHLLLAEKNYLVVGSRMLCSPALTEQIEAGKAAPLSWNILRWINAAWRGEINRIFPLLNVPGQVWRKLRGKKWRGVRTFNLAVWRKDFENVNGFDESFQGWGHEDADLAIRLMNSGVRRKDGQFALPVLHLWHKESDRGREAANRQRLNERIAHGQIGANVGLDTHLHSGNLRE